MECGRTPEQVRNVLAILGDDEDSMLGVCRTAVTLAEAEHARLTLVKTCDGGRAYVWVAPFAAGGAYVPPVLDSPEEAARVLARVADGVPNCLPVTMLVLGSDTQGSLLKLLRSGDYGAVVADAAVLSHCRRVRRQLGRHQVRTILVSGCFEQEDVGRMPAHSSSSRVTEDGAPDAQVSEGGRSRHIGLRPGFARRLAGAGGHR